jgi:uncharacterized protein with PIN domain
MLGKLCRWLRILGFDCEYAGKDAEDEEVLRKAINSNRILLTRDEELARKARDYCKAFLVKSNNLENQFAEVAAEFALELKPLSKRSLCPACGGEIKRVSKQTVKNHVFPRVFKRHREFWQCTACGKIYWKGTHWREIKATAARIKRLVSRKKPRHQLIKPTSST